MTESEISLDVAIAALGGAAVGVERQWSGNRTETHRDFAGVRAFTLLGAIGRAAGVLWSVGLVPLVTVLLAGVAALIAAALAAAGASLWLVG